MRLPQHLTIGLISSDPGWEILLEQIGAIWEVIPADAEITAIQYSLVIANGDSKNATTVERLIAYLEQGGSLLEEGTDLLNKVSGITQQKGKQDGRGLQEPRYFRNGVILPISRKIGKHVVDAHSKRRLFPAPSAILPSEIVASHNKGAQRIWIHSMISLLHSLRGLPFATRWRFPNNAPTIFCYRIDSDYGTQAQINQLHHISQSYQLPITWFLHTQAHEGWLGRFAEFEGDELGVHCYRHRTFRGYRDNLDNIRHAIELLNQQGIYPDGFAAPNGFWNPGLADAIAECGFLYSSEFSLGYDDLPFHPWCSWRGEFGLLQVPIHPVSPGNFRRVGATTSQMIKHYHNTFRAKLTAAEPIIFYDHPTHERWDVTEAIFEYVRQHHIPAMTMGEYAAWWLQRSKLRVRANIHDDLLTVETQTLESQYPTNDVRISIEHQREKGALLPANVAVHLNSIHWDRAIFPPQAQQSIPAANFKMLFHSVEDFLTRFRQ